MFGKLSAGSYQLNFSVEGYEQQGRELGRVISAAIQSELIKQRRPGGLLR